MFVKTFKKNYHLQLLLLIIVPLLLWIPIFTNPPKMISSDFDMPIYQTIYNLLSLYPLLSSIIAFFLIYLQAILLNSIFSYNQLSSKTSFFPAFIYLLILSSDKNIMTLNPIIISNTFVIIALYFIFKSYDKRDGADEIFNSALLISLSSLTYSPSIFFILWIWLSFIAYKNYKWRLWIISLLGLITPYILLGAYYFIIDKLEIKTNHFLTSLQSIPDLYFSLPPMQIIFYIGIGLFTIISLSSLLMYRNDSNISFRKKTSVIVLFFIISLFPCFYFIQYRELIIIAAPAMAYLFSYYLFQKRKLIYSNIILSILIILVLAKFILSFDISFL
ncbi:MAG: hypothetical protein PHV83_06690 [Bacteroidales bacterium]|nr:hypothetical protein [Bacteroidales bacterium]